ncbi:serine carboxypeptidase S28 [Teladorsagia circumcincta]|uniref:Serine carboxypeptidase S28 n=1 Tax=Teladorsagia circumcincta TaxID=45464 RepID=A0A2G9U3G9_TELCI|nr:serine carboxypeptidase S28 [Teladorsagia circumcincta]
MYVMYYVLQKYFKNDQWAKSGGPIFLKIGGESPARSSWVLNGNLTYLKWAEKFGATVYHLEHRYYGDSHLFGAGDAFKNKAYLSYLSSLQMLYDVANFIRTVNIEMNLTEPAKWILFGGSYSGSLALWMRELFPGLVYGAVGSSAPLEAKLDFYGRSGLVRIKYSIDTFMGRDLHLNA